MLCELYPRSTGLRHCLSDRHKSANSHVVGCACLSQISQAVIGKIYCGLDFDSIWCRILNFMPYCALGICLHHMPAPYAGTIPDASEPGQETAVLLLFKLKGS